MALNVRLKYLVGSVKMIFRQCKDKKESGSGQFKRGLSGPAFRLDT